MTFIFLIIGFAVLIVGGDLMIKGAVALAERFEIPHLIIGLTIIALGTSAPELFVSIDAALADAAGIAIGNVIGSNIANILAVLGFPALIAASGTPPDGLGRNLVFMIAITVAFMIMMTLGTIHYISGFILIIALIGFLYWQYCEAVSHRKNQNSDANALAENIDDLPSSIRRIISYMIFGLLGLQIGAQMIVESSVNLAQSFGVSDAVIGATIVAVGTSLPELAASFAAALKGRNSLALGNVIGSNIYNIAAILGITALITPLPVDPHLLVFDMWIMLAAAMLLCVLYVMRLKLNRAAGLFMSGAYIVYLVTTFIIS